MLHGVEGGAVGCGSRLGRVRRMSKVVITSPEGVVSRRDTKYASLKAVVVDGETCYLFHGQSSLMMSVSRANACRGASSQKSAYCDALSSTAPGVSLTTRMQKKGTPRR